MPHKLPGIVQQGGADRSSGPAQSDVLRRTGDRRADCGAATDMLLAAADERAQTSARSQTKQSTNPGATEVRIDQQYATPALRQDQR